MCEGKGKKAFLNARISSRCEFSPLCPSARESICCTSFGCEVMCIEIPRNPPERLWEKNSGTFGRCTRTSLSVLLCFVGCRGRGIKFSTPYCRAHRKIPLTVHTQCHPAFSNPFIPATASSEISSTAANFLGFYNGNQ